MTALGIGFVLASAASYLLSRRLGVLASRRRGRRATSMPSQARNSEGSSVRRGLVVAGVGRVDEDALDAVEPLDMDEDAFRTFYDLTSSAVWAYLSHITGDPTRPTTSSRKPTSGSSARAAGGRATRTAATTCSASRPTWRTTATVVTGFVGPNRSTRRARDGRARRRPATAGYEQRADLRRALARLSPRDRQMLWLAYAEGSSHREIADTLGLRAGGIRVLLFRARRKLAALLAARLGEGRAP